MSGGRSDRSDFPAWPPLHATTIHARRTCNPTRNQADRRGTGRLAGARDGRTQLVIRYGDLESRVAVSVAGFDSYPPVHFANDVVPLFSKLGCNSGGCHGKQSGQNGFRLSVFGFDPKADYDALTKE